MFLHVFRFCVFSRATRLLAVDATCLSQTWSTRSTVPFRFFFKEFPLEPNNELKREIPAQLVKFCEKQPTAKNLWLRCNSLSSVISVSLTTPQIYRTTLSQNTHCEMNPNWYIRTTRVLLGRPLFVDASRSPCLHYVSNVCVSLFGVTTNHVKNTSAQTQYPEFPFCGRWSLV